jgi:hypothetical protein
MIAELSQPGILEPCRPAGRSKGRSFDLRLLRR